MNVSAYTYYLIRKEFVCEYREKLDAKGKGAVDMYFVVGVASRLNVPIPRNSDTM